jgi:hypothetical protein
VVIEWIADPPILAIVVKLSSACNFNNDTIKITIGPTYPVDNEASVQVRTLFMLYDCSGEYSGDRLSIKVLLKLAKARKPA